MEKYNYTSFITRVSLITSILDGAVIFYVKTLENLGKAKVQ